MSFLTKRKAFEKLYQDANVLLAALVAAVGLTTGGVFSISGLFNGIGRGGANMPEVATSGDAEGLVLNYDGLVMAANGKPIEVDGNEVFIRPTALSGTDATVKVFYKDDTGAEVDTTIPEGSYTFVWSYRFERHNLPYNANTIIRTVSDPESVQTKYRQEVEKATVSATNTIDALTGDPVSGAIIKATVYGVGTFYSVAGGGISFNETTKVISWDVTEYDLETTDIVVVEYETENLG